MTGALARRAASPAIAVLLGFVALAVLLCPAAWTEPGRVFIGLPIGGDPHATMWFLAWLPRAAARHVNPFLTDYIDFPGGVNVMWSNANAVAALALPAAPLERVLGPVVTYNFLLTGAMAFSAWLAYVGFRRYAAGQLAPVAGALVYGFGPYATSQALDHLGLAVLIAPAALLLLFDELLVRRRRSPYWLGLLIGVTVAFQVLVTEEMAATEAIIGIIALALLATLFPGAVRATLRPLAQAMFVAVPWCITLVALPLGTQFLGPRQLHGLIRPTEVFVNDLQSFVVPDELNFFNSDWSRALARHWTGNPAEWNGYLGAPLIAVLGGLAWFGRRNRVLVFALVMTALCAVLSMGPHLHVGGTATSIPLLWRAPEGSLLANILPSRLMAFGDLFAGMALAVGLAHLTAPRAAEGGATSARTRVLRLGIAALAVVPLAPSWPLTSTPVDVPAFFQAAGAANRIPRGSVALIAPFAIQGEPTDAMLWQAVAGIGFKTPEGYALQPGRDGEPISGPPSTSLSETMISVRQTGVAPDLAKAGLRQKLAADLKTMEVGTIIVGPMENRAATVRLFTDLLGRPPDRVDGVEVWWNVDLSR